EAGYETLLGESGTKLSGGEKQRLSIARAIIKDAPVVLLDEMTANMDVENEIEIQMALQELLENKTILMISHKLSAIKNADQILVLENGVISQRGTHKELVSKQGLYKRLWDIQCEAEYWSI
ncbi:MAG: ATP-binding cassette domain-containing protein, partial [Sphaerochaetaceae bacterium]